MGSGQEKVEGQDGYSTTFTTVETNQKTYIEYKQNGVSSWSANPYWDDNMENSGCGITAMSIILSGYGKNKTPEDLRQKYFPVLNGANIPKELSKTFGIKNTDFYFDKSYLSSEALIKHLATNRPILICVWTQEGENRWTTASHYMVLLATDGESKVYLSNPNGIEDYKASGWYNIDEITPYIAKAMYIQSYK